MSALAFAPTLQDPVDGAPTLDEVIVDVWEGLADRRVAQCPVCPGRMRCEDQASLVGRCEFVRVGPHLSAMLAFAG